jgi:hypothetical protein
MLVLYYMLAPNDATGDVAPPESRTTLFLVLCQNSGYDSRVVLHFDFSDSAAVHAETSSPWGLVFVSSTADQHVESQLYDLRELASRRSFEATTGVAAPTTP